MPLRAFAKNAQADDPMEGPRPPDTQAPVETLSPAANMLAAPLDGEWTTTPIRRRQHFFLKMPAAAISEKSNLPLAELMTKIRAALLKVACIVGNGSIKMLI